MLSSLVTRSQRYEFTEIICYFILDIYALLPMLRCLWGRDVYPIFCFIDIYHKPSFIRYIFIILKTPSTQFLIRRNILCHKYRMDLYRILNMFCFICFQLFFTSQSYTVSLIVLYNRFPVTGGKDT